MSEAVAVLIQVVSVQEDAQKERQTLRRTFSGELRRLPQGPVLRYVERDEEGAETDVEIRIEEKGARLLRRGICAMELTLVPGETSRSVYQTPYGAMDLTVRTQEASFSETGAGAKVGLRYDVYVQAELLSRNTVQVTYRVKP